MYVLHDHGNALPADVILFSVIPNPRGLRVRELYENQTLQEHTLITSSNRDLSLCSRFQKNYRCRFSTIVAIPCPPPMHAVARPYFALRRRNSCSSVITNRVPVAPSGCPRAIAPPLTLTLLRSRPSSFSTARYCPAKASFTSIRSISSSLSPAFLSATREAGTGPLPMILGSTPAMPQLTMRPMGFSPRFSA